MRKASVLTIGGFRPVEDPLATHFGLTPVALPGESWPVSAGKPLFFVCQLNLTECPFVPEVVSDIRLLTFFVDMEAGEYDEENGSNWIVRTYSRLDDLTPLNIPENSTFKRGFQCRWELVEDHRSYKRNVHRTKVGGYPSEIQAEQWWDLRDHPDQPQYCLQIDSEEKVGLMWGDRGTVYLARGAQEHWFLDWQCY